MIDLRYHIATIIAIFLALGVGILIGSTVVGGDVLVDQQKKMIDQLEGQFDILREHESELLAENKFVNSMLGQYEDFSRAVLPPLIKNRLKDHRMAIVVTGGTDIPSGLLNSLSLAGAKVTSTTVILPGMVMTDQRLKSKVCNFYDMEEGAVEEEVRGTIARNIGEVLLHQDDAAARNFLQENNLVKFNGEYAVELNAVLLLGGTNNVGNYFPETVDVPLIYYLTENEKEVYGVEASQVQHSYMQIYQRHKISTVDDIEIAPGQVALIRAMEGEAGDYGVKSTAKKFIPSLPAEYLEGM
ncbi:MAG: copper transporter [Syntrophomonadaceae bacterium]|jgi:hypothetical protein|nr:copper transporter [Syntrophomonadaceae bacterium]